MKSNGTLEIYLVFLKHWDKKLIIFSKGQK